MEKKLIHEAEEQLKRTLLMMKYDTSKTLNENKEVINEIAPIAIPAFTIAVPWLWAAGTATVAGIGTWIYNVQGGGDSFTKTKTFFEGCNTHFKNLKPTIDESKHRDAASQIYNAIKGMGTNEDAIREALMSMPTVADLCQMYKFYQQTYGDLYDDLDSDIDGEDFTQYVWSAMAGQIADAQENLKEEQNKVEDPWKNYPCVPTHPGVEKKVSNGATVYEINGVTYFGNGRKKSNGKMSSYTCSDPPFNTTQQSYTYCKGPEFNLYCKNEKIKQLQACLGMDLKYQTGNFGPITSRNLTNIGYKDNKITSDQIDRICKRTNNTSTITPATQYGTTTAPSIQGGISGGQQGVGDVEVDPNGY
jgi:hypothetical protein